MKIRLIVAAFALTAPLVAGLAYGVDAPARTFTERLGGMSVTLPVPAGYSPPEATPASIQQLMSKNFPDSHRLIGILMSTDDVSRFARGQPISHRAFMVMTSRKYEFREIPAADFEAVKRLYRERGDQFARAQLDKSTSLNSGLTQDIQKVPGNSSFTMQISNPSSLGVFDDRSDSVAFVEASMVDMSNQGRSEQTRQLTAIGIVLLHGRPITIQAYADYGSPADLAWVKAQVTDWIRRTEELNRETAVH